MEHGSLMIQGRLISTFLFFLWIPPGMAMASSSLAVESRAVKPTLVELRNGDLGIWLREDSGELSQKIPPPRPSASPASPSQRPVESHEVRIIKEKISHLSVKGGEWVSLAHGAEVGSLHVSGKADVEVEEEATVAHAEVADDSTLRILQSGSVSFVTVKGHASVHGLGGKVAHLTAGDSATVHIDGMRISHLTLKQKSAVRIDRASLSFLTLEDEGQAFVHQVEFEGGNFSRPGFSFRGGGILFAPQSQLHIYGSDVSYSEKLMTGKWSNGRTFSIPVVEHQVPPDLPPKPQMPALLPPQVIIHPREP